MKRNKFILKEGNFWGQPYFIIYERYFGFLPVTHSIYLHWCEAQPVLDKLNDYEKNTK